MDTTVTVTITERALPLLILLWRNCDPSFPFLSISFRTENGWKMKHQGQRSHQLPEVRCRDDSAPCPFPRTLGQRELQCYCTDNLGIPQMEGRLTPNSTGQWSYPRPVLKNSCWKDATVNGEVETTGRQRGAGGHVTCPAQTHSLNFLIRFFLRIPFLQSCFWARAHDGDV